MDAEAVIRSAPPVIEVGDPAASYHLDEGLVSIQGGSTGQAVATFEGGSLVVAPLAAAADLGEGAQIGPVYRQQGGGLAVPTGRVFVRFQPEADPRAHTDALVEAGFELDEVVRYAPHAAWVSPRDTRPASALNGLEKLRSVSGVEHVEPQVLSEAVPRGNSG